MERILLSALFAVSLVTVASIPRPQKACGSCAQQICLPVLGCEDGYPGKDSCNCCDTCIKTKELVPCGGIMNMLGECGNDMMCHVRHPNSHENRDMMPGQKIGRCEKAICQNIKCGKHQFCSMEAGTPNCVCRLNCDEDKAAPVCGFSNGKQYKSHCSMRKEECTLQKNIGAVKGRCKKCYFKGKPYGFGDVVKSSEPCVKCTCNHGNWQCNFDLKCLNETYYKDYECTGYTNLHDRIRCKDGYKCVFTKVSNGVGMVPSLGFCVKIDPAKTCMLPASTGTCFGYFQSWFFNARIRKCQKFIYGGCDGNDNRFETLQSCQRLCGNYKGPQIDVKPVKPAKPVVPNVPDLPKLPVLPNVPDLPKVPVVPNVPDLPKVPVVPNVPDLPKVPVVPNVPDLPKVPVVPNVPDVPKIPDVPKVPDVPKIPDVPKVPGVPKVADVSSGPDAPLIKNIELPKKVDTQIEVKSNVPVGNARTIEAKEKIGTFCRFGNELHKVGEDFISSDCRGRCKCSSASSFSCVSLCPPVFVECTPFQKKVDVDHPVAGSNCTCKFPQCGEEIQLPPFPDVDGPLGEIKGEVPKREAAYGEGKIRIHGKVSFKKSPGKLPVPSCLRVVFEDISIQDDDAVLYETKEFNVSSTDINADYEYSFTTQKPRFIHEFYAVSAVLNVGWCPDPDSDNLIRDFDFLSDTTIYVPISENTTDYEVNVPVVFYCRGDKCNSNEVKKDLVSLPAEQKSVEPPVAEVDGILPPKPIEEFPGNEEISVFNADQEYKRKPQYGNGSWIIRGKIAFAKNPGIMPTKSCLVVELRDTSLADASSVLYEREVIDVSGVDLGDKYHYKLKSKRPKNVHNSFSVSATLNVGWCAKSSSGKWIQSKDYLTDTTFNIDAWKSGNEFQRDLTMVYYCSVDCDQPKTKAAKLNAKTKPEKKEQKPKVIEIKPEVKEIKPEVKDAKPDNKLPQLPSENQSKGLRIVLDLEPEEVEDVGEISIAADAPMPVDQAKVKMHDLKTDALKSIDEMEKETDNGYSHVRKPVYGDENLKISGKIEFNKVPGKLPSPSCLNLFFEDISFQDVSSVLYAKKQVDVSGFDMNKTYQYSLETKKPESTKQTYSISVVLNTGWCPAENSTAWLRNDDFLSEVTVKVPLNKKENEYARDIAAVYYCRGSTCNDAKKDKKTKEGAPNSPSAGAIKVTDPKVLDDGADSGKSKTSKKVVPPKKLPVVPTEKFCIDYETKKQYKVGEEWFGVDDCMHCTCIRDGYPVCSTPMCGLPFCTTGEAIKISGRCCPVCPEDHVCRSANGRARIGKERWQEDDCKVCECTKEGVMCVDPSKFEQRCKYPQRWNGKCKPVCLDEILPRRKVKKPKGCVKPNGLFTPYGSTWKMKNNCTECECSSISGYICKGPTCEYDDSNCEKLERVPGDCCPQCKVKKCRSGYMYHRQGERIFSEGHLSVCECDNGNWKCKDVPTKSTGFPNP